MTDYTPIDCGSYSQYELAILRGSWLRASWRDADGQFHMETLQPIDLVTRDHAEFLVAASRAGKTLELRLDYIHSTEPV